MEELILQTTKLMSNVIESYEREISKVSTGRANPNILNNIKIELYGQLEPLKSVAAVKVPEARQLLIKPYDPTTSKSIAAALNQADLKVQIKVESDGIRLIFPVLTQDLRKKLVKELSKTTEEYRVKIRNLRRDAINEAKKAEVSEDILRKIENDIQKLTNEKIDSLNNVEKEKVNDLMSI